MRVLVTGGAGFIGSHIVDRLLAEWHEVIILDDFSSGVDYSPEGWLEIAGMVRVHRVSLEDFVDGCGASPRAMARTRGDLDGHLDHLDAVVHCAAYAELRHNWDNWGERARLLRSNVIGTMTLLEAMPVVPIVFLSTAAVYGSCDDLQPARELDATPERIQSPYAATKLACEALVAAYAHKHGSPWHVLRLVNVVGARTHRGVISDFVRMARANGIHAIDDGRQKKPWVHVTDVVDAVLVALGLWCDERPASGIYNVTSDELVSWWDVVDAMGVPRDSVTFEARDRGAVGDPHSLRVSGAKLAPYFVPHRLVRDGIRDALTSLGWERP